MIILKNLTSPPTCWLNVVPVLKFPKISRNCCIDSGDNSFDSCCDQLSISALVNSFGLSPMPKGFFVKRSANFSFDSLEATSALESIAFRWIRADKQTYEIDSKFILVVLEKMSFFSKIPAIRWVLNRNSIFFVPFLQLNPNEYCLPYMKCLTEIIVPKTVINLNVFVYS